jgi:flagellar protein FlaI
MASFLYFCILRRVNITVTGETDTGKTTLINALDLIVPRDFRKIYVESAIESLNQREFGKHQLKYHVDQIEDDQITTKYSKSNQIKKLLHRSPDIIYLGEILTREEAEAFFHCLSAGLKGFQTVHSASISSLLTRFNRHFKINSSCFSDLDLLILMKKDSTNNKRRVIQIAEIGHFKTVCPLFEYSPQKDDWDIGKYNLYNYKTIQKLLKYETLDEETFYRYLNIYKQMFELLKNFNKMLPIDLVEIFHEIGHISRFGLQKLEEFWNAWKNKTY